MCIFLLHASLVMVYTKLHRPKLKTVTRHMGYQKNVEKMIPSTQNFILKKIVTERVKADWFIWLKLKLLRSILKTYKNLWKLVLVKRNVLGDATKIIILILFYSSEFFSLDSIKFKI